jgi:hypothetical protein
MHHVFNTKCLNSTLCLLVRETAPTQSSSLSTMFLLHTAYKSTSVKIIFWTVERKVNFGTVRCVVEIFKSKLSSF